jgi:hypothetical protein
MEYSSSRVLKYETCPYAFEKHYIDGIRPEVTSANLVYGKVIHAVWGEWLKAWHYSNTTEVDLPTMFEEAWGQRVANQAIEYNTQMKEDDLLKMGKRMCEMFPEAWEKTGLVLADDGQGPMLERHLRMRVGGITFQAYIDLIALDEEGRTIVPDLKTPAAGSAATAEYVAVADQLTAYNIVVDANLEKLGLDPVHKVGYIEGIKGKVSAKAKGPQFPPPLLTSARTEEVKLAYIQKLLWVDKQVKAGAFFRRTLGSYNTPCKLCDYQKLCAEGSMEGLVVQKPQKAA